MLLMRQSVPEVAYPKGHKIFNAFHMNFFSINSGKKNGKWRFFSRCYPVCYCYHCTVNGTDEV